MPADALKCKECSTTYPADELREEQWLDANSVQFLVNRFNGTLIRAE